MTATPSDSGATLSVLDQVLADLAAESAALEAMVADLDESGWRTPTPAAGWDVATQVAHLAWTDEVAVAAATDKETWDAFVLAAIADPTGYIDAEALAAGAVEPAALLDRWKRARSSAGAGAARLPRRPEDAVVRSADEPHLDGDGSLHGDLGPRPRRGRRAGHRSPSGPTGSATSHTSASAPATSPSRRTASSRPRGVPDRAGRARRASSGSGDRSDAAQRVTGSAYDFCLRVTQRRHRDDLDLVATGPDADRWLDLAQAFAGPPGEGRSASGEPSDGEPPSVEPVETRGPHEWSRDASFLGSSTTGAARRQLQRLLRRPPLGHARAARGGLAGPAARRGHGRLPRRADHADPGQGPAQGPRRSATPAPSSARSPTASLSPSRRASGSSRTPVASTRPDWSPSSRRWRPSRASPRGSPGSTVTTSLRGLPSSACRGRSPRTPTSAPSGSRGHWSPAPTSW